MSLYERITKVIASENIDDLYNELKALLASENKRILFPRQAVQAVEIYRSPDDEYIVIEFYLTSISVWIKINRDDDYIETRIFQMFKCDLECS
jgi:hypothetical protein